MCAGRGEEGRPAPLSKALRNFVCFPTTDSHKYIVRVLVLSPGELRDRARKEGLIEGTQ